MITVTKSFIPDVGDFNRYLEEVFASGQLTNNGPLVRQLEARLQSYLGVDHLILVGNGTLALQVALKALKVQGEVITTPFSFVATSSVLVWDNLNPVYCDISSESLNLDCDKLEKLISDRTGALMPVHVFGNPCDVERLEAISAKYSVPIIYDASHAFGVLYKGESLLQHGRISTLSFHATKLFHTIEGGAIITSDDSLAAEIRRMINFSITGPEQVDGVGINAKMSEVHAAMGLCQLDNDNVIYGSRAHVLERYSREIKLPHLRQQIMKGASRVMSYAPIILESEEVVTRLVDFLAADRIYCRRYFSPSLDILFSPNIPQHISRDIASRIVCLPLFSSMTDQEVTTVIKAVNNFSETQVPTNVVS